MRSRFLVVAAAVVMLVMLVVVPAVSAAPSLKIASAPPKEAGPYTLVIEVAGFDIVAYAGHANNRPGEGHIHYLLNGEPAPGDYATTAKSFAFPDLKKGDSVSAELVNNDHSSLNPRVIEKVSVPGDNGIPAPDALVPLVALFAVALYSRRRPLD